MDWRPQIARRHSRFSFGSVACLVCKLVCSLREHLFGQDKSHQNRHIEGLPYQGFARGYLGEADPLRQSLLSSAAIRDRSVRPRSAARFPSRYESTFFCARSASFAAAFKLFQSGPAGSHLYRRLCYLRRLCAQSPELSHIPLHDMMQLPWS